jgi:hypothetical protein
VEGGEDQRKKKNTTPAEMKLLNNTIFQKSRLDMKGSLQQPVDRLTADS